jgi:hypothetical protein
VGYGAVGERYEREIDGWDREMGEKREAELTDVAAGSLYTWTRSCTAAGNAIDIDTGISSAGGAGTSFCGGGCFVVVHHSSIRLFDTHLSFACYSHQQTRLLSGYDKSSLYLSIVYYRSIRERNSAIISSGVDIDLVARITTHGMG